MILELGCLEILHTLSSWVQYSDISYWLTRNWCVIFFRHHVRKLLLKLVYLSNLPIDLWLVSWWHLWQCWKPTCRHDTRLKGIIIHRSETLDWIKSGVSVHVHVHFKWIVIVDDLRLVYIVFLSLHIFPSIIDGLVLFLFSPIRLDYFIVFLNSSQSQTRLSWFAETAHCYNKYK
jgi:hypothetical protein